LHQSHSTRQGIVASASGEQVFRREVFFPVDPSILDSLDREDVKGLYISGFTYDLDYESFYQYLPKLEVEIFWLTYVKKKAQKDTATLLGISQPTVSYRYRRARAKLQYIQILDSVEAGNLIADFDFLKLAERDVIYRLCWLTNQEMVGKELGLRQSSVKWIFTKTKNLVAKMERDDPDKWRNHYGLLMFLGRNLGLRVRYEDEKGEGEANRPDRDTEESPEATADGVRSS
jgi:hypothetical protein